MHRDYSCIRHKKHSAHTHIMRSVPDLILNKICHAGREHRKKRQFYEVPINFFYVDQRCEKEEVDKMKQAIMKGEEPWHASCAIGRCCRSGFAVYFQICFSKIFEGQHVKKIENADENALYPEKKDDVVDAVGMICVIDDQVDVDGNQQPKSYVGVNSFGFQAVVIFSKPS